MDLLPKAKQYYYNEQRIFYLNYYGGKYKLLNNKKETHNIENVIPILENIFQRYKENLYSPKKNLLESFKVIFKVFVHIDN